jgi:hypothetical protein
LRGTLASSVVSASIGLCIEDEEGAERLLPQKILSQVAKQKQVLSTIFLRKMVDSVSQCWG